LEWKNRFFEIEIFVISDLICPKYDHFFGFDKTIFNKWVENRKAGKALENRPNFDNFVFVNPPSKFNIAHLPKQRHTQVHSRGSISSCVVWLNKAFDYVPLIASLAARPWNYPHYPHCRHKSAVGLTLCPICP